MGITRTPQTACKCTLASMVSAMGSGVANGTAPVLGLLLCFGLLAAASGAISASKFRPCAQQQLPLARLRRGVIRIAAGAQHAVFII